MCIIAKFRLHSSSIETRYIEVKSQGKVRISMNDQFIGA